MKKILILTILLLLLPSVVSAKPGIKVDNDKITIKEPLQAGEIYRLDEVRVLNNGGDGADYKMNIRYQDVQQELMPKEDWFRFIPDNFYLESSESKVVEIIVHVPTNEKPGNYFAFIDIYPSSGDSPESEEKESVRFYFSVAETPFFVAIYNRISTFFTQYSPGSYIFLFLIILLILGHWLTRRFKIKLKLSPKNKIAYFGKFRK